MRDKNVFAISKALPRMSWSPRNLYNIYRRSLTELRDETVFTETEKTIFQQRWASKRLTRAYHGDFINEKIFKRWYLPSTLPDVRPHRRRAGDDREALNKWSLRPRNVAKEVALREEEDRLAQAPVASLMYEEVERRIDVFLFRCCFAHSVYEARRMVIHGRVLLNGKKHSNANTRLAPGDMVTVDPKVIRFLREPATKGKVTASSEETEGEKTEDSAVTSAETSTDASPSTPISQPNQLTPFNLPPYAAPFIFIPAYIEVSFATCSAIFVRRPTARYNYSEVPSPYEADGEIMRLSWEWYNNVRPRLRSKSQLARMPENRKETRKILGVDGSKPALSRLALPTGTSLGAQIARNSVY